jgi:Phage integrase family
MRRVTRHTLRHTALSWMAQHGEPLQKIARFAGHSSTHVTEMFYAHLHREHLKDAAGVIDTVLGKFGNQFGNQSSGSEDSPKLPSICKLLIRLTLRFCFPSVPEWRNRQTRETQDLVGFTARVGSIPSSGTS